MRGLPPFQALVLLIVLAALGVAGSHYIDMGEAIRPQIPSPQVTEHHYTVEAEIEFIFSSPPLSYQLTKPSTSGEEGQTVILSSPSPMENPSYGTVNLVSHQPATYWLDIIWPDNAEDGTHHFVQINVSPNHGSSQQFSFFSDSKVMNETFEYNSGEHHHE